MTNGSSGNTTATPRNTATNKYRAVYESIAGQPPRTTQPKRPALSNKIVPACQLPRLHPKLNLDTRQSVAANKQITRAKPNRTFQQKHGAQGCQRRGKPRTMQLTFRCNRPRWNRPTVTAYQFFGSRCEVSILDVTDLAQYGSKQCW